MTNRTGLLFPILLSALGVIAQPRAAIGDPDPTKDWPKPELRSGLTEMQIATAIVDHAKKLSDTDHFSGVVLAANGGTTVVARAFGFADLDSKTPNTIDTAFNIGSLNKVFTKTAIAQLAQAGKLSLDDTVRKRLPGVRIVGADKITIRQLLDHRSGMGDIFNAKYEAAPPSRLRELSDFLPLFANDPLGFEPGTAQRYSNAGYITLGLIVEAITGEKYRDYVTKHIFAPANMTGSGWWAVDERVATRATGYTLHGDDRELTERVPNTKSLPGRPSSAGGAFATAGDLLGFYQALLADRLLSTKWTNWMVNGSFDDAGRHPAIGVGGGAPGINAAVELVAGWTVIALANFDPPSASAVARGAKEIILDRRVDVESQGGLVLRRRPPSVPANTELTRDVAVPAKMSGHLFTIEAKLNGKGPFRFAVDSGLSGMLVITPALQNTLRLPQIGEEIVGDPSGKHSQKRATVHADSVEIGGARFTSVDAVVDASLGGDAVGGVIGLALFANLTATLDYLLASDLDDVNSGRIGRAT